MNRGLALLLALAFALPVFAADAVKGGRLYRQHCAACHGALGQPTMPSAPNFARGESLMQPDPVLLAAIRSGRAAMPGYFGILNDRDILDIVAYLRTLR